MTATRRAASTLLVLAMLMAMTAIPAFAAAIGSASITSGDLLSGQGSGVTVRIANGGSQGGGLPGPLGNPAGNPINAFSIEVPGQLLTADSVTFPTDWDGEYDSDIGFVFGWYTGSGTGLAPGSAIDVTINGTAVGLADDASANVPVFVSDDNGTTLTSAGAPALTSRILHVAQTVVQKPNGAVETSRNLVTAGQTTARFWVKVQNFGTATREVTLDVARAAGSSDVDVVAKNVTAAPGQMVGQMLDATFGNAGSLDVDGTAVSGSSSAVPFQRTGLAVQQKFAGTYTPDSLRPDVVVQGNDYSFELDVDKTGAQPADLATTFKILGVDYTVNATTNFGASSNRTTLSFPSKTVPALAASGEYDTKVTATGVDHNGADVSVEITPDVVNLDNLLPYVTLNADVGPSAVTGADPAAGNGRNISFDGEVRLGDDGDLCGDCVVTSAVLITDGDDELPFTVTNTAGLLQGNASFTFPEGTVTAYAKVTVEKTSGLEGEADSNTFEVDIITPELTSAVTGRDAQGDFVRVYLSEKVNATGMNRADWTVDNNTVTSAAALPQTNGATLVTLRLLTAIGDNDTPTVTYSPNQLVGQRMSDRVALNVLDKPLEAIDGIVPAAPIIQTVQGLATQDGAFWTNNDSTDGTTVTLAGMVAGDSLYLYFEPKDGNGIPEDGEQIFAGAIDGETQTVTIDAANLPSIDTEGRIMARMFDDTGFGDLDAGLLNVDYTVPEIASFSAIGNDVTVTFTEPLARGRNAAFDWTVAAVQDGVNASRTVSSVSGSGTTRTLSVSTASYDPTRGSIGAIRFKYRGAEADRYDDRATNGLPNQVARL